jgi:hypothetical protein
VDEVRVTHAPQPERHLPACQPRIHPRGRAALAPSPDAISPLHSRQLLSSTVQAFPPWLVVRCRLLTSAERSGKIPPPSVLCQDTPQLSRGQLSDLPCIDAGCIKSAPPVDGGLYGRVPTRPERTTPHIRFVSLAPHVRSTLPSDPASRRRPCASLVLRLHGHLDRGLSPPSMTACPAHTPEFSGARLVARPLE